MMRPKRIKPGPGQESVWDYPRPAVCEETRKSLEIRFAGRVIAQTGRAFRVLETSHPPTYYLPPDAFVEGVLVPARGSSVCEWKGVASYFDVVVGAERASRAGWCYPTPTPNFEPMAGYVSIYAHLMEGCFVDGEKVQAQEGDFYGGWITSQVVGPFKGAPGTWGW
ncbi:MAG: DUF427 domain-containing protein [Myxococcota bacterium]